MKRLLALACLTCVAATGSAQEMISMAHPTGDQATSLLLIEATNPGEVRVGQTVNMTVKLTNLSKTVALRNVKLTEHSTNGIELKKVVEASTDEAAPQADNKDAQAKPKANAKKAATQSGDGLTIDRLAPGESRTFKMEMVGDEVGMGMACFGATYEPVLCVQINYVKPDLDLVKDAPEQINICEQLVYNYLVKNSGNGVAKNVVLTDKLPEGLTTTDGKNSVEFEIGNIEAGKSVQKSVELNVVKPGSYSSRAMAEGENLSVKSKETTTKVSAFDLSIKIEGPKEEYINKPVAYTITVTNNGDAVSKGTKLEVNNENAGRMVRATEAGRIEGRSDWNLGDIKAGESKEVRLTMLTTKDGKEVTLQAIATSDCAAAGEEAAFAKASSEVKTEIVTLPALRLSVVDSKDNLSIGEEFNYEIEVLNQGSASDQDLQIIVQLPEGIEFVETVGEVKATTKGQAVKFNKVDAIKAGETITFTIKCKATKVGDYRTTVKMNSEYLDSSVPDVEPTRVVK